jgi:hypothetical protein
MTVTVEIPDAVASSIVPEGADAARKLLEDTVAQAYRDGKLTTYEVQMALGLPTRMHVDPFLGKYQIYDYTIDDFREDMKNLRRLHAAESVSA